jgi:hypothetical protein
MKATPYAEKMEANEMVAGLPGFGRGGCRGASDQPVKPPAEGHGDNRRVLPGKPDAIHSGARKVIPPAYGETTGELQRPGCRALSLIYKRQALVDLPNKFGDLFASIP